MVNTKKILDEILTDKYIEFAKEEGFYKKLYKNLDYTLYICIYFGDVENVKKLLLNGADVDFHFNGISMFEYSSSDCHGVGSNLEIVKLLVEYEVDEGHTRFSYMPNMRYFNTLINCPIEIFEYLFENYTDFNDDENERLLCLLYITRYCDFDYIYDCDIIYYGEDIDEKIEFLLPMFDYKIPICVIDDLLTYGVHHFEEIKNIVENYRGRLSSDKFYFDIEESLIYEEDEHNEERIKVVKYLFKNGFDCSSIQLFEYAIKIDDKELIEYNLKYVENFQEDLYKIMIKSSNNFDFKITKILFDIKPYNFDVLKLMEKDTINNHFIKIEEDSVEKIYKNKHRRRNKTEQHIIKKSKEEKLISKIESSSDFHLNSWISKQNNIDFYVWENYPLVKSLIHNKIQTFYYLVDNGADIHTRDDILLQLVLQNNNHTLLEYLLKNGNYEGEISNFIKSKLNDKKITKRRRRKKML